MARPYILYAENNAGILRINEKIESVYDYRCDWFVPPTMSSNVNIEIRTATSLDAASACRVLRRSIAECCIEDHRNNETILAAWLGNKTPETVKGWFQCQSHFSVVAVVNEEVVGVATLTRSGKVVLCYVTPEMRHTGAGKALLQALEAQAVRWGMDSLQLVSTVTARAFYLRNGYIEGGTSRTVFGIDAIAFSKRIHIENPSHRSRCRCG